MHHDAAGCRICAACALAIDLDSKCDTCGADGAVNRPGYGALLCAACYERAGDAPAHGSANFENSKIRSSSSPSSSLPTPPVDGGLWKVAIEDIDAHGHYVAALHAFYRAAQVVNAAWPNHTGDAIGYPGWPSFDDVVGAIGTWFEAEDEWWNGASERRVERAAHAITEACDGLDPDEVAEAITRARG